MECVSVKLQDGLCGGNEGLWRTVGGCAKLCVGPRVIIVMHRALQGCLKDIQLQISLKCFTGIGRIL